jgi:phosphate starvation-inducible protein PhoH
LATKKNVQRVIERESPPETLDDCPFFGLSKSMNDEQREYVNLMWRGAKTGRVVFVEGKSGSGKTTLAVLLAVIAMDYGLANRTYYIRAMGGSAESKVGYRPGLLEKTKPYFIPVEQALLVAGISPERKICYGDIDEETTIDNPIYCSGQMYMRGCNLGSNDMSNRSIVIIDEAQNATIDEMRLLLTRVFDNSLVVVIGHREQIDLPNKKLSGFVPYIKHFLKRPELCDYTQLTKSRRGKVAEWADEINAEGDE